VNGFESALSLAADALRFATAPAGYGIAVWVLAIIFAWSGIAKLQQPLLTAMAMVDFGVLRRVRLHLGSALGAAELSLALLLVTGALRTVSLAVAAALLWIFVLLIAKSLWAGKRFACFCFGEADSELSRLTLVRTATLALLATVVAVGSPPTGALAGFGSAYALQGASAAAIVGAIVLIGQILKLLHWNKDPYRIGNPEVSE
jgi:hypothetical protein